MFVDALLELGTELRCCFLQARVLERFLWFMMAWFSARDRHTLSVALPPGADHSSYYRLFSKARWSPELVFRQILGQALPYLGPKPFIPVGLDDTYTPKTGRLRGLVRWVRDAVKSTAYKVILCRGLRWIHAALLVFIPGEGPLSLTIAFELAQPLKRPRRGASAQEWKEFRRKAAQHTAPALATQTVTRIRAALDHLGQTDRLLLMVVDNGYMNRTFLRALPSNTGFLGRVRGDARLVNPAEGGGRRLYGPRTPTPQQLHQEAGTPWIRTRCYFGGGLRKVRYKELAPVRWQHVTRGEDLRLLVVAPTSYWLPGRGHKGYNQPAYLLTSDLVTAATVLLQTYFERWQMEIVHRDLKSGLGCGEPQVWSRQAVNRVVPAIAAFYSLVRIAALQAVGPGRDPLVYGAYPPYRRAPFPTRPSVRDLQNRLRSELRIRAPGLMAELA